jgi:hypothetical protein
LVAASVRSAPLPLCLDLGLDGGGFAQDFEQLVRPLVGVGDQADMRGEDRVGVRRSERSLQLLSQRKLLVTTPTHRMTQNLVAVLLAQHLPQRRLLVLYAARHLPAGLVGWRKTDSVKPVSSPGRNGTVARPFDMKDREATEMIYPHVQYLGPAHPDRSNAERWTTRWLGSRSANKIPNSIPGWAVVADRVMTAPRASRPQAPVHDRNATLAPTRLGRPLDLIPE